MTEYGRGAGSQPWYPEDPLYGDPEWHGQQSADSPGPYGGPQQHYPPQPPQPPQPQPPQPPHQPQWQTQGGQYVPQQQYGWDPSQTGGVGYAPDPGAPYGQVPYAQQPDPYDGSHPGYYGTPDAYPPPQPHHQQRPQQEQYQQHPQHPPEQAAAWQPEADDARHPFFAEEPDTSAGGRGRRRGRDGGPGAGAGVGSESGAPEAGGFRDADDDAAPPSGRRGGRGSRPKRRSGLACLVVAVVLAGAVGGAGYLAYDFWQEHFGAPPDYAGGGSGQVQIEIPDGANLTQMGNILKNEGVVKSVEAFTDVAGRDPEGQSIQAGVYTLKRGMSAKAAVDLMTDPANLNTLTIPEGWRASKIYDAIDKKLQLQPGTTEDAARNADLGLPAWAKGPGVADPNEGLLFPAQYGVGEGTKPEELLKQMVQRAEKEYGSVDLEAKAEELGLGSPRQLLTVASLVQAEGRTKKDFEKVARVIYNRLKPDNTETNGFLDFDSTYNYAKDQSTLEVPPVSALRTFDHPYNTYNRKGLPPGPIGNPGAEALHAALNPADGGWYYFVSLSSDNTVFSETYQEHQRNVEQYNEAGGGE